MEPWGSLRIIKPAGRCTPASRLAVGVPRRGVRRPLSHAGEAVTLRPVTSAPRADENGPPHGRAISARARVRGCGRRVTAAREERSQPGTVASPEHYQSGAHYLQPRARPCTRAPAAARVGRLQHGGGRRPFTRPATWTGRLSPRVRGCYATASVGPVAVARQIMTGRTSPTTPLSVVVGVAANRPAPFEAGRFDVFARRALLASRRQAVGRCSARSARRMIGSR